MIKLWDVTPQMDLLSERGENEAYLAGKTGEQYAIYSQTVAQLISTSHPMMETSDSGGSLSAPANGEMRPVLPGAAAYSSPLRTKAGGSLQ